jgi:hypothetical protein
MQVGDDQVAALRALLNKDFDEHKRLTRLLDDDGMRDYMALVTAAFLEAVDRRFENASIPSAVVEYVGQVRSRNPKAAEAVDPVIAERVLLKALGQGSLSDLSGRDIRRAQNLLLPILVDDEHLDDAGIDAILAAARKLAQS